jgi:hypothetical protein
MEFIDVWKIKVLDLGSWYLENNPQIIIDMLTEMEYGSSYLITKQQIERGEYKKLPEFTGF